MQAQAERAEGTVAAHGSVGEGRVADREVEMRPQLDPREILIEDPRMRLQEFHDPGGHRIELDTCDVADVAQCCWHQRWKQAAADAGFEHPAAAEPEPLYSRPDRANDVFRREVGVLRAARERSVGPGVDKPLELSTDLLPAFPECVLAWTPEDAVGEPGRAKAGEADQVCLFVRRRRPIFGLDHRREPDRCEIIARAIAPALREPALAVEMEILAANDRRLRSGSRDRKGRGGCLRRDAVVSAVGFARGGEGPDAEPEAGRERRITEEIESEGVVESQGEVSCLGRTERPAEGVRRVTRRGLWTGRR